MGQIQKGVAKLPPFKVKRTLLLQDDEQQKILKKHKKQVGEIVHHWNQAQGSLFWVFWAILDVNHATAYGMWYVLNSDSAQRELLKKTISNSDKHTQSIKRSVIWLCDAMASLSSYRNDAAHVEMVCVDGILKPNAVITKASAKKRAVERPPLEKTWKKLRGDLIAIHNYGIGIHWAIKGDMSKPYYHRPNLQFVAASNASNRQSHRPRRKAKRPPQPQS